MFINNVTGDANNTEGIGSIYSFKLMSYALSQIYNIGFVDNKLQNLVGNTYVNMSSNEYDEAVNSYFDLGFKDIKHSETKPFDIIFDYSNKPKLKNSSQRLAKIKKDFFIKSFGRNINKIHKKRILINLCNDIQKENNDKYFKEGLNIVIHIRAPLPDIDIKFEPDRSYFYGSYKDIDLLNNFIRQVEHSEKNQKLNFHLLTTGRSPAFKKISTLNEKNEIFIHENVNIFDTFSMMIHNDAFVGGFSNLSYIAHLLSNKKTIFPKNCSFGNKPLYPDVIRLDENGMIERLNSNRTLTEMVSG